MRPWLAVQSLLLALVVTWPAAADLGGAALGHGEGDIYKHLWTLWWMRAELLGGEPGLRTTLVSWPGGMDLWPIEPLNGLLQLLLPGSTVVRANLLAIGHSWLLGLAAGWFGQLLSRRAEGGHVAAALAQASAFAAFTLHVGVGELRQVWWLPLGLGCLVKARDTGAWRWFLALACTLVAATLACFYYGFFLALAVSVYALATFRLRLTLRYAVAAALAIAAVVGPVRSFTTGFAPDYERPDVTFEQWMADIRRDHLDTYPLASVGPDELYTPRPWRTLPVDINAAYVGGRYLGLGALLLAGLGLAADRRRATPLLLVGATGLLLSFGTVLWWRGAVAEVDGARVVLPLAWINRAMRYYLDPINFPARFIAIPTIALAGMGALATRWRWTLPLAVLATADLIGGDIVGWPRATAVLPDASLLAGAPGAGAVADLTPFMEMGASPGRFPDAHPMDMKGPAARRRAIAAQIALDRPFDAIPIERLDRWAPEGFLWVQALPLVQALAKGHWRAADGDWRESLWLLRDRGFGGVLLTYGNFGANPAALRFLSDVAGPATLSGAAAYWPVPEVSASPEEAEAWRAEQALRVKALPIPRLAPGG